MPFYYDSILRSSDETRTCVYTFITKERKNKHKLKVNGSTGSCRIVSVMLLQWFIDCDFSCFAQSVSL